MSTMGILDPTESRAALGRRTIGVVVADRLYAGLLSDSTLTGPLHSFPQGDESFEPEDSPLVEYHMDALVEAICQLSLRVAGAEKGTVSWKRHPIWRSSKGRAWARFWVTSSPHMA